MQNQTMTAEQWNEKYPPGTPVRYHPIIGRPANTRDTQTRSQAWTLASGDPLVMINGVAGGVALAALVVLPAPEDDLVFTIIGGKLAGITLTDKGLARVRALGLTQIRIEADLDLDQDDSPALAALAAPLDRVVADVEVPDASDDVAAFLADVAAAAQHLIPRQEDARDDQ